MSAQACPNRFSHGIQPGCITCSGTGRFSLPEGAWRVLDLIVGESELIGGDKYVAAVLSVRGLCLETKDGYVATRAGVVAYNERNGVEVVDAGSGGMTLRKADA